MRVEISSGFVVSLRPKGAAFGQAGSTRLDSTNEARPPPFLATDSRLKIKILQQNVGQKWLGCMLTAAGT